MLAAAGVGVLVLFALNRLGVRKIGPYVIVGLVVWVCVLKSGIHATLAGVVTAMAVPLRDTEGGSPLEPPSMRCTRGSRSRCCRCSRS
jgi:NhaA family Na+:H+ antiporter